MGELVQYHVVPVTEIAHPLLDIVPGQDHFTVAPRLAQQLVVTGGNRAIGPPLIALHPECRRINQDRGQLRVDGPTLVDQQQAGLRGDGDPHFIGDGQAATTVKPFLGEENLDQLAQPALLLW